MIKKLLFAAIAVYSAYQLTGCCQAECLPPELYVSFQNYSTYETDTVIFVGTSGDPSGTYSKDTFALINNSTAIDTGKSILSRGLPRHDNWTITLPSVNKQFKFSNFQYEKQKCLCSNKKVDALKSYAVNGVTSTAPYCVLAR